MTGKAIPLRSLTIPLLPIVCKVLAEWMDEGRANWSGSNLFGDGELLVIATVIAAAGIGDLVFDLRRNKRRGRFRDASAIALALVCVVASVTLFALVTLKREQLTPAQQTVASSVEIQQSQLITLTGLRPSPTRRVVVGWVGVWAPVGGW